MWDNVQFLFIYLGLRQRRGSGHSCWGIWSPSLVQDVGIFQFSGSAQIAFFVGRFLSGCQGPGKHGIEQEGMKHYIDCCI